jgi:hypothetical protein
MVNRPFILFGFDLGRLDHFSGICNREHGFWCALFLLGTGSGAVRIHTQTPLVDSLMGVLIGTRAGFLEGASLADHRSRQQYRPALKALKMKMQREGISAR